MEHIWTGDLEKMLGPSVPPLDYKNKQIIHFTKLYKIN